jgi:single-strand DNA-binding protein
VCNFSVAEDIGYGDNKRTQWWRCALWGARAEKLSQYLTKGTPVTVVGNPELREFDKKDGTRGAELNVRVVDLFLQGRGSGGDSAPAERPAASAPAVDPELNDEIPF